MRRKSPFHSLIVGVSCAMVGCILASTAYSRRVDELEIERDIYASRFQNWQMRAIDAVPYAEQAQGLDEFLVDPKKAVQELQDMHAWWRSGDVERLDTGMRADMAAKSPQSYKLLDVDRNNAWLPQIEKRLTGSTSDDTLVVVGALHLLGSDGLVEKLKAKGYKVERVCDACEAAAAK